MNVEDSDDDFEAAVASIVEANLSVVRCLTAEDGWKTRRSARRRSETKTGAVQRAIGV
jgi:hypothetical protein